MARKRLYKGCKGGSIPSLGTHKESENRGLKPGSKARKPRRGNQDLKEPRVMTEKGFNDLPGPTEHPGGLQSILKHPGAYRAS